VSEPETTAVKGSAINPSPQPQWLCGHAPATSTVMYENTKSRTADDVAEVVNVRLMLLLEQSLLVGCVE